MENILFLLVTFLVNVLIFPFFIKFLKSQKSSVNINVAKYGKEKLKKDGTPVMGGMVFILIPLLSYVSFIYVHGEPIGKAFPILISMFLFFLIGSIDDLVKVSAWDGDGITERQKIILQVIFAWISTISIYIFRNKTDNVFGLHISNALIFNLIFFLISIIWIVGWNNATNITDGLDGLLSGLAIISYSAFAYLQYRINNSFWLLDSAIVVSLLAFLIFNKPKARIFMGDTGSLAIGAGLAVNALILNNPWILIGFGLIYAIETVTTIIQVFYFHKTGKRFFPMAPIHHTFEKFGWSEWKIDIIFWTIHLFITLIMIYLTIKFSWVVLI
jgi:phospho-N-acetylmuramoyl-pentapeptide-transferase